MILCVIIFCVLYVGVARYNPGLSYCRSKLANIMFARELAKKVSGCGVTVCSLHPGTVYTEITRHLLSGWLILLKVCLSCARCV